ncbi:MAG: pitrilysin family protein [Luteolibacter sp.]
MEYPLTQATVETLPNGLTVILDPDRTAPVVSAQFWVGTGSIHEDRHLGSGLSHFLEHMVFKGTRDFDAEALADTVQGAGGHWNAYTTFDRTVYYIDGPAKSLPVFLKVLTGLVFFPTLPAGEFEREKDVIRREIDMGLDDPDNVAMRLMLSTAYQMDARRHPVIGHRHLFDQLRHEDMLAYHRSRYTTERCFVVISGDFDGEEIRKEILELTAGLSPQGGRDPLVPVDFPQIGPREARGTFAIPTSRISLAWKCSPLEHPDAPAFDVLAAVLGRGRSSRLHHALRETRELALDISSYAWTGPGREGLFGIGADALPENRETLIEAIREELAKVAEADLTDDVEKAKRQISNSQFRSLLSASGRATDLASNWHEARDLNFTRRYLAAIRRVTPEDVKRALSNLVEEKRTLTLLDPLDTPAPQRGATHSGEQARIETFTLSNGLKIALIPDRRVPLVHLQAAVRSGLPSETPETNGINQLLASTLSKGTATRSAAALARELESLGASLSANIGNNAVLVQAGGLAADIATIADVFCEVLTAPAFPEDAVAREKVSQLAALEEALEDPLHAAFQGLRQQVFSGAGYGLDPLGSLESVPKLDCGMLAAHHARHFTAANMALVVAGDFDAEEVKTLLESKLAGLPAGEAWQPPASLWTPCDSHTSHLPKKQAVIAIGYPGASALHEDRYALAMIQEYASDMAGPLFARIREDLGLAYRVGATQFLGFDTGLFTFYVATSPEQAEEASQELLSEIRKIADHGIPTDALERVCSTVLSGLAIQRQSPSSVARQVAIDLLFGQPADQYRRLEEIYQNLSGETVREVAARIFGRKPGQVLVAPKS